MPTLSIRRSSDAAPVPVWRDGALLDAETRTRALPLVVAKARVRVTPENASVVAGWGSLEQAIATLYAVYGLPLPFSWDGDPELVAVLFRRAGQLELGLPEPV